ncbi:MAG: hypothetical protein CMJ40_03535 [Phycisphaerae bacterium]|nr:hypothetical protein [Phycisphaerae bacterium]
MVRTAPGLVGVPDMGHVVLTGAIARHMSIASKPTTAEMRREFICFSLPMNWSEMVAKGLGGNPMPGDKIVPEEGPMRIIHDGTRRLFETRLIRTCSESNKLQAIP